MANFTPPNCPNCNAQLILKKAETGLHACPNWRRDGTGCKGTTWYAPKGKPSKSARKENPESPADGGIFERELIERLDKIIKRTDQILYFITGIPDQEKNPEKFKKALEDAFGKGLLPK